MLTVSLILHAFIKDILLTRKRHRFRKEEIVNISDIWQSSLTGFIVQQNDSYFKKEVALLRRVCELTNVPLVYASDNNLDTGAIPCGADAWVRDYASHYGISIRDDPYPEFLNHNESQFEIKDMITQFRVYISNSVVRLAMYSPFTDYSLHRLYAVCPSEIPEIICPNADWCGAIDFGILKDERTVLIEAYNNPFSCGWYGGRDLSVFAQYCLWLRDSWDTMLKLANK